MILTFKPQFVEPIKAGTKIHTIREDKKGRWKTGMKIQFWNGNPRNVKAKPHQFQSGICTDVKQINIDIDWSKIFIIGSNLSDTTVITGISKLNEFAVKDGFKDWNEMRQWFMDQYPDIVVFVGKIIYFKVHATS